MRDLDEEVGETGVVVALAAGDDVLAVTEAAAGHDERDVAGAMGAGVAEIATRHDDRVIEQGAAAFPDAFEQAEEAANLREFRALDDPQLLDLSLVLAVVRKVMPVLADALDLGRRVHAAGAVGDEAGRVGLESQRDHLVHQPGLGDDVGAVRDILRRCGGDLGLGTSRPGGG